MDSVLKAKTTNSEVEFERKTTYSVHMTVYSVHIRVLPEGFWPWLYTANNIFYVGLINH